MGREIIISGEADEAIEYKHEPKWNILKDYLFFDQRIQKGIYHFVCHNLISNFEEWRVPLNRELDIKPRFNSTQDKVFVFSSPYQLTAIGLSPSNKAQKLWFIKMDKSINEIRGSGDGHYVYTVDRILNKFIKIDTSTKKKENLGAFATYKEQKIVDTSADIDFLKQPF